jgi:hypothetical protein
MRSRSIIVLEEADLLRGARQVLASLWREAALDGFFVSTWIEGSEAPESLMLEEPTALEDADPFAPVMRVNNAGRAVQLHKQNTSKRIGFYLRPCELRSYWSIVQLSELDPAPCLLISSDCLGVYPDEDYRWRAISLSDPESLTQQSLRFSSQGGILPSRNRHGCQLCDFPAPSDADVQIGLFGLQSGDQLMIEFQDHRLADTVLADFKTLPVDQVSIERRSRLLEDIGTWRRNSLVREAGKLDPDDLDEDVLIEHLSECEPCSLRLKKHCPSFTNHWSPTPEDQQSQSFHEWIVSCGGCGICDHQCPQGFPLFDVIRQLSFQYQIESNNAGQPSPV